MAPGDPLDSDYYHDNTSYTVVAGSTDPSPESCLESVSGACWKWNPRRLPSLGMWHPLGTTGFHGDACTLEAGKLAALRAGRTWTGFSSCFLGAVATLQALMPELSLGGIAAVVHYQLHLFI